MNTSPQLESWIAGWRKQMLAAGIKTPVPLEELESHLREETEQQMKLGVDARQAFYNAIERMGEEKNIQREFSKVKTMKYLQFFRIATCAMIIGLLVGICLFYFLQPLATTAGRHYSAWLGMGNSISFQQSALGFIFRSALGTGLFFSTVATLVAPLIKATRNRKKSS